MWIYSATVWVLLGVLTLFYLYVRRQFSFWARMGVPYKKVHIFFGSFEKFVRKRSPLSSVLVDLYEGFKGERFAGVWEIYTPMLFVLDPVLLRDILVKDFGTWSSRGMTVNLDVEPMAANLVTLDGKVWKSVRAKLTPTFTSSKLKHMHYLLLECGKDLKRYLETVAKNGEPVEVRDMAAEFTTDVIASCAFGIQMNSLDDDGALFRKMGKKIFDTSIRRQINQLIGISFPWLFKLLKLQSHLPEVSEFFLKITKENFEYREKNNVQRHDFIDLLRKLKNTGQPLAEDEVEFNDELLAAQSLVFFGAGFETSSSTIAYCLHELAINQEIQDRLREEIRDTVAENNGDITWDGLKNMKYLNMVVQETLRKYPIAPQIERKSVKPYRIPDTNVEVPEGMTCIIPIYAIHHDPDYYPDPEKFDPERFTDEAKSQRTPFTYLPFGGGPRVCIGLRIAEQQTKMAIVTAISTCKFSLCKKSQNPIRFDIGARLLFPEDGVWLKISHLV